MSEPQATEVAKPDNIVSENKTFVLQSDYPDIDNSFNFRLSVIRRCFCEENKAMLDTLEKETIALHRKVILLNDNIKLLEIIKTNKIQSGDVLRKLDVIKKQIIDEYIKSH